MRIIREYDFNDRHYGLVELDNGSKVEIKGTDPLAKAMAMLAAGAFLPPIVAVTVGKTLADFSDAEIAAEVSCRKLVIKGMVI